MPDSHCRAQQAEQQDGERSKGFKEPLKVVFVYADQKRAAQEFAKLLKLRRIDTQILPAYDLDEQVFAGKDLIIIGADTTPVWGFNAADDVIKNAKLPILAMGGGGQQLLSELGMQLGNLNVNRGELTTIQPVVEAIFWDSFRPQPTEKGTHDCFTKSRQISIQHSGANASLIPIGHEVSRDDHYLLIAEKPFYLFWGFDAAPDQMTGTGKELLPWACYYTVAMKKFPERAFAKKSEVQHQRSKDSE
ncbi:hypothetical protein [Aporhodopirellula aestuarii]|uniref:Uncharacterized protein n=1 Tax=Aporhodopirellula aestuarii TaxID=2950107 RepID=A0ABT0U7D2_9BACT|nr:hypothetical protein [Aporhodopirellula aestuarii]MCM2372323.1 hypothetical protein [Aporhodopirellula aestuarii]